MGHMSHQPQVTPTALTPNAVEVLLFYHCFPTAHPRHNAPAVKEARDEFVRLGALKQFAYARYSTTQLGRQWVKAICSTPMPELVE